MVFLRHADRTVTMPQTGRLEGHYDTKYEVEKFSSSAQILEYRSSPSNRHEACLKFFLKRFNGGDILELGAGSGLIARSLIAHGLKFDSYTLSELSGARLEGLLRDFKDPRIRVLKLDAESLPSDNFPTYDAIIMLALIEHLIDPLGAMRSLRKLLKPSGFVFIDTPNIAKFTRRAKLLLGRFPATASRNEGLTTYDGKLVDLYDEGHLHYFTCRSLSLMLIDRCGFSRVEKLGYFIGPNGQRIFGHKFGDVLARLWPEMFSEIVLVTYA
jgi:SAM-dependent methyltransferase